MLSICSTDNDHTLELYGLIMAVLMSSMGLHFGLNTLLGMGTCGG